MQYLLFLILFGLIYTILILFFRSRDPEIHWDWSKIDYADLDFPSEFIWGTSTAAHQVEGGCDNNNWYQWEQTKFSDGRPHILNNDVSGAACEHWDRFADDFGLVNELGCKGYRFSVEWSKIEPQEGQFDQKAIEHYRKMIEAMRTAGLEPMLTLHHFTNPIWFEEKGAFEQESNINCFVRFCEKVFTEFSDLVHYWCTINEIEVYATQSYFQGGWPPGVKDPQRTAVVMCNLLESHVRVYKALKALPGGPEVRIGLVKNIFQFDPKRKFHLLDNLAGWIMNRVFNGGILDFLNTGRFRLFIPGMINISHTNLDACRSNDFIGLNYYSHMIVNFKPDPREFFEFSLRPNETSTDMDYTIYPEGFYRALHEIGSLGLPVYVTENGIADEIDDRRADFTRHYIYAMNRALKEGVDIRGYFYWSLLDNFEWAEGYSMKFGLYAVDFQTQERKLRTGSEIYREIIRKNG